MQTEPAVPASRVRKCQQERNCCDMGAITTNAYMKKHEEKEAEEEEVEEAKPNSQQPEFALLTHTAKKYTYILLCQTM